MAMVSCWGNVWDELPSTWQGIVEWKREEPAYELPVSSKRDYKQDARQALKEWYRWIGMTYRSLLSAKKNRSM